ncbi:MAG: serine hydrolase, partial [Acidobacteria bacterium]|nr:serine hydrolase [Acidobacteriota bacterium]
EPVQPDSIFRIASVSKPLTSIGLMKLRQDGKLTLDDRIFVQQLSTVQPPPGLTRQASYDQLTLRQILQHTAGLPSTDSNDPMFSPRFLPASQAFGATGVPTAEQFLRWQITRPLINPPGQVHSYSNVSLFTAGRVLEAASGKKYENFMREDIFAPLGITKTRLGRTRLVDRFPGEVRYHMPTGTAQVTSVYGDGQVDFPYGGFALELIEGAGAWTSTAVDLARIFSRLSPTTPGALLNADSLAEIAKRPPAPLPQTGTNYYGLGFNIFMPASGLPNYFHSGSLPGTRTYFARFSASDITYVVLFNMRPTLDDEFLSEVDRRLGAGATMARTWPTHDLWGAFLAGERPRFSASGLVSAASFRGGAIAPGQIVTLFGDKIGGSALVTAQLANNRLTTLLDGTRVLFDGTPAAMVYTSGSQISAIVPYNVAGKTQVRVTVERLGVESEAVSVPVAASAPALFTANSSGTGPVAAITYPDARIAVLYGTGEGISDPTPLDGALAVSSPLPSPRLPVKVFVGGREVKVLYAGAAPGLTAGLFQINIEVPEELASQQNLPVELEVGGNKSLSGVTLSLRP